MLSDQDRLLLTGSVDGELSAQEQLHVQKLLKESPEARKLLKELQEDSQSIRNLPRLSIPIDLVKSVTQGIRKSGWKPRVQNQKDSRKKTSVSRAIAMAALVLVSLGLVSYLFFNALVPKDSAISVAVETKKGTEPTKQPDKKSRLDPGSVDAKVQESTETVNPLPADHLARPDPVDPALAQMREKPSTRTEPEMEREPLRGPIGPILTDRGLETFEIKTVEVTPPVIRSIHELTNESSRSLLKKDLTKTNSYRLELPVVDANRTLERVESVCKAIGLPLTLDATAKTRLVNKNWKTNYIIYTDSLAPEDLVTFLKALGDTDKPFQDKKQPEVLLNRFILAKLNQTDRRELADLLGIDSTSLDLAQTSGLLGVDLKKPIQDQTANQVIQSMVDKGTRKDCALLALPFSPVRPSRSSVEIKQFLESRHRLKPNHLQLMIVLRNVG